MARKLKLPFWAIIGAALAAIALAGVFIAWRATRALHQSAQEVRSEHEIRFLVRPFLPPSNVRFEAVSSPDVFLQAARFQNHLFIAGPAGAFRIRSRRHPAAAICGRKRTAVFPTGRPGSGHVGRFYGAGTCTGHSGRRNTDLQREELPSDLSGRCRGSISYRYPACGCRASADRHKEARRTSLRWETDSGAAPYSEQSLRPSPRWE